MKKFGKTILCTLLALLMLAIFSPKAMAASASFTGSSSVRAGDSVTLTLSVSGNIYGLSGTLSVGSGLTFTNYNCADSSMTLTVNGNNFAAYGTSATTGKIITVTLKVDGGLAEGTALNASFKDIVVSDGDNDSDLGTASWSGTVAGKPSSVCHLTAIRCSNATLSPAFNKDTTYYTANVPYSVSKLSLDYDRADKSSTVSISGTDLAVGANTITIKVTAADGSTKTYTLSVTRQQDPNYKPGTDATLKELTLDAAAISPAFRADCTDYIAYVPFETKEATLSGVPTDSKAVTSGEKTIQLTREGANDVSVICTAEDGSTIRTYTVHVYRMPAYTGILPTVEIRESSQTDLATETVLAEELPVLTIPAEISLPLIGQASTVLVAGIAAVVVLALLFLLGLLIGRSRCEEDAYIGEDVHDPQPPRTPAPQVLPREVRNVPYDFDKEEEREAEIVSEVTENASPITETPSGEPAAEESLRTDVIPPAEEPEDEIRAAEKAAENMSLDDLLNDIRDM